MSEPNTEFRRGPVTNAAGDGVETTGVNAAQGRRGLHTFRVLIASVILVVVVLFGLYFLNLGRLGTHQGTGAQTGVNNPNVAAQFHQDAPTPKPAPPGGAGPN